MKTTYVVSFLLALFAIAACGSDSESQYFSNEGVTEEVRPVAPTAATPTVVPATDSASTPSTTVAPVPTTTIKPWVNPWPEIGSPLRVVIHTGNGWPTVDVPVYQHEGVDANGDLTPLDGQAANWVARGFSNPGEEGYSMLAGHQSQIFEPLADGGISLGTKIEIHTDLNQVIHLTTLHDPRNYFKSEDSAEGRSNIAIVPWDEITMFEMGTSIITFITCGDRSETIRSDGYSAENWVVRASVDKIEEADGTEFVPWG